MGSFKRTIGLISIHIDLARFPASGFPKDRVPICTPKCLAPCYIFCFKAVSIFRIAALVENQHLLHLLSTGTP